MNGMNEILLEVNELKKYFPVTAGLLISRVWGWVKAVDGVSFTIRRGETFGLVGESGCGKTTTAKTILLLERPTAGTIRFKTHDITTLQGQQLKAHRAFVQAVFQDPYSSLDPRKRVGSIVAEPLLVNRALSRSAIPDRVTELLQQVGLDRMSAQLYPHEFSGGQRQRIAIARALALNPDLIVLDEPVSALDVSIRAQIMNLLKRLQEQLGLTYLLIAHDLATVRYMSTTVGVMYLGRIVETAAAAQLFERPLHPYSQALVSAALPAHPDVQREEIILSGEVPSPLNVPSGCRFHPRCPQAMAVCSQIDPVLSEVAEGHQVACHLYGEAQT